MNKFIANILHDIPKLTGLSRMAPGPTVPRSSLSKPSLSRTSTPTKPPKVSAYDGLAHAPGVKPPTEVKSLNIKVEDGPDGSVPAFLHLPRSYTPASQNSTSPADTTAAILLSGAGGGVVGPSSIYLSLADKLASLRSPIPSLRLDYRYPARNKYCVRDVMAAMEYLGIEYGLKRFVLVGWSFGGAPVFTVGGEDRRVVGCATVASQTAETEGIRKLSPRPVLLLHGTGDRTLSPACSERLYEWYGRNGERELKLFEGDDHALTWNSCEAERLIGGFVCWCAGVSMQDGEEGKLAERVVGQAEQVELMRKGGDLRGEESVD